MEDRQVSHRVVFGAQAANEGKPKTGMDIVGNEPKFVAQDGQRETGTRHLIATEAQI